MATNRTKRTRGRRKSSVSPTVWALMNDQPFPPDGNKFERLILESSAARTQGQSLQDYWLKYRDKILEEWISKKPGTRPSCWWRFDAPQWNNPEYEGYHFQGTLKEPRRRLGGTGTPAYECLGYMPDFSFGIPETWVTNSDEEYYNGRATGDDGELIETKYKDGDFDGKAIDSEDPPVFESQAGYLKRHDLLFPAEFRWLEKHPEALDPETLTDLRELE